MTATRRSLLAAMAATAGIGTAAPCIAGPAVSPDAELVAVCSAFHAACINVRAIFDGPHAINDDDQADAAAQKGRAEMERLLDRMGEIRASTPVGIQARAQTLAACYAGRGVAFDDIRSVAGRMLGYLMRDAATVGGLAISWTPTPKSNPPPGWLLSPTCSTPLHAWCIKSSMPHGIEEMGRVGA